ncbi:MAG: TonB-dependent receptor [Candidatus Schekmanbacteria bacterium]|nr:TonB-dependent receptor [Candidatus Schekmanbacteria bacterium]
MRLTNRLAAFLALLVLVPWAAPAVAQEGEAKAEEDIVIGEEMMYFGEEIVVVTASKHEQKLTDTPSSMSVITTRDIETSTAASTADLLKSIPGLNVVQLGARDYNVTGRSAATTLANSQLVLVDGRSVYQDFYGFVGWDLVPMDTDDVRQVEVVRGPGSAMWGANAMTGVINIRTKTPKESKGLKLKMAGGELNTRQAAITWAGAGDKLGYKVHAAYFSQDAYDRPKQIVNMAGQTVPLPQFEDDGTEQPKFSLRVDYDMDRDQKLWFDTGVAQTSGLIHTGIGPFRMDDPRMYHFKAQYDRGPISARFFFNWLDGQAQNLLQPLTQTFDQKTYDLEVDGNHLLGTSHLFTWGLTGRYNNFDLSLAPSEDSRTDMGVFAQDEWLLHDKFTWALGFRVDNFSTIGTAFSPRTNAIFKITDDHSLKLGYSEAYRAPSLIENYLETTIYTPITLQPGVSFVLVSRALGNEDLDEEHITAMEVGYTGYISRNVNVSTTYFRNRAKDFVDFYPAVYYSASDPPPGWPLPPAYVPANTFPKIYTYRNVGETEEQGVEFSFGLLFENGVNAKATYTWQDEPEVKKDKFDPVTNPGGILVNKPSENTYFLEAGYNKSRSDGPVVALSFQHSDETFNQDVLDARWWGDTEAYDIINATFGWKFIDDKLRFMLKGTNLTDEKVQQHIFGDIISRRILLEATLRLFGTD